MRVCRACPRHAVPASQRASVRERRCATMPLPQRASVPAVPACQCASVPGVPVCPSVPQRAPACPSVPACPKRASAPWASIPEMPGCQRARACQCSSVPASVAACPSALQCASIPQMCECAQALGVPERASMLACQHASLPMCQRASAVPARHDVPACQCATARVPACECAGVPDPSVPTRQRTRGAVVPASPACLRASVPGHATVPATPCQRQRQCASVRASQCASAAAWEARYKQCATARHCPLCQHNSVP